MSLALIITTFNRSELLAQCLDSLSRADLSKVDKIVFIDDRSDANGIDKSVGYHTMHFACSIDMPVTRMINEKNSGIKHSLQRGFDYAFTHCDLCVNLDPDTIVKPDFINTLLSLREQHPKHIISGFNCNNPANPVLSSHDNYVTRKHCNGINMLMDKWQYEKVVKPALSGKGNWDFNSTHDLPFVISRPSCVQHIGANNSSMGHANGDIACDFKLLTVPNVSLFGIDAHDPEGIKRAADICTRDVEFAGVKIITERLFSGRVEYSRFMIRDLWEHVKDLPGTHILTIHADGYVQRPEAWDNEWLKCDFIGATWTYKDGLNVGNGGFSLRSKKFIEACSKLDITDFHPEDCKLSRKYRPMLEQMGLVWATEEQANRFSIEAYGCGIMTDSEGINAAHYCGSFGFHGAHVKGLPNPPKSMHRQILKPTIPPRANTLRQNRVKRF